MSTHLHIAPELFQQLSRGSQQAYRAIYDAACQPLYAQALRMTKSEDDAQELVQEVFIKLWIHREKLDSIDQPHNYLFRMLVNQIHTFFRKESNWERIIKNATRSHSNAGTDTLDVVDYHQTQQQLQQAIEHLSPQQRTVYILSEEQGLSNEQIARQLRLSVNTVKVHMNRARHAIQAYMKDISLALALVESFRQGNF